jgi:Flp pilus assembly protein TadD
VVSQPVVQAVPNGGSIRLNDALARLARSPGDVAALIDAGNAALALGDTDAAIGFFRKADTASPGNAAAKVGLARSYVAADDPVSAIPWFNAAEKAGAADVDIAGERGLAYDLVGDNLTAQRYYNAAMAAGGGDDVRMRLALSQAIGGDQKTAEATLMPLLRKQDKPGWRTRAFALAIGGDVAQAVELAQRILPPPLAESIAPYLRYMPRLTRAQQAAAANLGRFPRASEIGFDDPRIAAYAPPKVAAVDAALVPKGEPLDRSRSGKGSKSPASDKPATGRSRPLREEAAGTTRSAPVRSVPTVAASPTRVAPPDPRPTIESSSELPPVGAASSPAVAISPPAAQPTAAPASLAAMPPAVPPHASAAPVAGQLPPAPGPALASTPAPNPIASSPAPTGVAPAPAPGFDLAALPSTSAQAPAPVAVAPSAPAASPAAQPSFADMFADFGRPAMQATPVSGAVDIREIAAAPAVAKAEPKALDKPVTDKLATDKAAADKIKADKTKADKTKADKTKADAKAEKAKQKKPTPPQHPSRIWVQIGVGRDKAAIAFDWRRYAKQAPALFRGRQAYVSEMGRTNRILAGPFASQKAADQFLADLKKAGIGGGVVWTSPAGQIVDALPGG